MPGDLIWEPTTESAAASALGRYLRWLAEKGRSFPSYDALWRWSVEDLDGFWGSLWEFFEVRGTRLDARVLASRDMPGAEWFPGARLNYAAHALRRRDDHPALIFRSERSGLDALTMVSYRELADRVAAARAGLERLGVSSGDRVVAYLPNIPETVIAFLATASLGAIWSSCSPDFGTRAVVDRFAQIEPKVLLAVDGYRYGGRDFDRLSEVAAIERGLPTLVATVVIPYLRPDGDLTTLRHGVSWAALTARSAALEFAQVPFGHPLWVLYSSGTTGLPKGLVHGHGGILLEHLKSLALHQDLGPEDRFFWFTTTGWMMWNYLLGILLLGGTAVLFDGHPGHPDLGTLWRLAADARVTTFGTSASFIGSCLRAGLRPGDLWDLSSLRVVASTGAPLASEGFGYVADAVKAGIPVASVSGGTDLCTAFVQANPLLPVRAGRLQCAALGANVRAFTEDGGAVVGEVGELVITAPMPSMPVFFWNDPTGERYRAAYFAMFPGVWRHGDWIEFFEDGSATIQGRSDATLNRGGVRMGTSEFYRVVEELPMIADSLVVDLGRPGEEGQLLLFVVPTAGVTLDDPLRRRIAAALRTALSPRHVPDRIIAVGEIPRTLNGKKLEVPVKRLLLGEPIGTVVSEGAVANPASLAAFAALV